MNSPRYSSRQWAVIAATVLALWLGIRSVCAEEVTGGTLYRYQFAASKGARWTDQAKTTVADACRWWTFNESGTVFLDCGDYPRNKFQFKRQPTKPDIVFVMDKHLYPFVSQHPPLAQAMLVGKRWEIHVNCGNFVWPNYRWSLYALVRHEVGHVLGHPDEWRPDEIQDVMGQPEEF